MASAASLRDALTRFAETLIIGAASGAVLGLAHFPAGWLSGSIIAVAAARCCAGRCWSPMAELRVGMGRAYRAGPTSSDGDAGAFHVPKPRCLLLTVTAIGARSCLMRGRVRTSAIGRLQQQTGRIELAQMPADEPPSPPSEKSNNRCESSVSYWPSTSVRCDAAIFSESETNRTSRKRALMTLQTKLGKCIRYT